MSAAGSEYSNPATRAESARWLLSQPLQFESATGRLQREASASCTSCRGGCASRPIQSSALLTGAEIPPPSLRFKVRTTGLNRCCALVFVAPIALLLAVASSPNLLGPILVGLLWVFLVVLLGAYFGVGRLLVKHRARRWIERELSLSVVPPR